MDGTRMIASEMNGARYRKHDGLTSFEVRGAAEVEVWVEVEVSDLPRYQQLVGAGVEVNLTREENDI